MTIARRSALSLPGMFVLVVAAFGCHHRRGQQTAQPCDSTTGPLSATTDLSQLSGRYDITFVATNGSRSGSTARGWLTLRRQSPALARIDSPSASVLTQPSIGTLDLSLDSIGAVRMGDPMSADSMQPGVGIYAQQRAGGELTSLVARIGSGSNSRGMSAMDAGHFTLFVRRVSPDGIMGGWTSSPGSGGMVTPEAQGHFCAWKVAG